MTRLAAVAASLVLAGCVTRAPVQVPEPPPIAVPAPTPVPAPVLVPAPVPPPAANARAAGVRLVAPTPVDPVQAARALGAFRISCPTLIRRRDVSGLTTGAEWQALCTEAATLDPALAGEFFRDRFDWVVVGPGEAFATGYYEPEIRGSRIPAPGFATPIYRTPPDLIRCTRADGGTGRGRIDASGQCVYFFTRAEIEQGALAGRGLEIGYAADPIDLFFLQIQGSGRLLLPDGGVMRIGYDNQNGREYVAIGRVLRERGILPAGGAGMKEIVGWMRANPAAGAALMRENLSYIFFKELTGPGPLGALALPVTPWGTVAADPNFVPLGAPVFLDMDRPEANGLWVAQDTGGAIKGANRFDTFWGAGTYAEVTAGGMASSGRARLLLPRGAAARANLIR